MKIQGIRLIKYMPTVNNGFFTRQLVACYRDVFADSPWNEWLKCQICGKYWGIKDKEMLALKGFIHCGVPLADFWSKSQVESDIRSEITKEASCYLALHKDVVIGFCWGYPIKISNLEKKLGIAIAESLECKIGKFDRIAYQDEVGVLPQYRGLKIAKAMVKERLKDFISQGLQVGIVRTRQYPEASVTFVWYKRIGYEIINSYPESDGRVVLGRRIDDLWRLL